MTINIKFLKKNCRVLPNGCWIWQGSTRGKGYAQITNPRTGKQDYGHRVVWELKHKRVPPAKKVIRHSCDTPPCICPNHVAIGTYSQNNKEGWERSPKSDMNRKSVSLRVSQGKLKEAFARGRAIGTPRGLATMNGGS